MAAAHGDDEILGCGGTMACHASEGDEVHLVLTADGVTARGDDKELQKRNEAVEKSCAIVGAQAPILLGFPDNRMDSVPLLDIVQALENVVADIKPDIIYTHHVGDLNIDHTLTHRAVLTACRPQPGALVPQAIYGFEILSSTEWADQGQEEIFRPVHYVEITDCIDKKLEALKCYDVEMREAPHARSYESVEAKAKVRGSEVGVAFAEVFSVIRQINPIIAVRREKARSFSG